ncbi:Ger(x)C family spore germination protein [Acetonema longum]|uniref:Germination protein, Ger(X)C family n=1 Tax=Acetonema longum DSM 6540 TaxID=1009370 RepID=F7NHY5_9FIRM|nr:Ger(x)C family spore germination protein [Acetonema longum]EGO64364.1 germination protein, Ger(x)C family [Acetonema longum DSM 6540]
MKHPGMSVGFVGIAALVILALFLGGCNSAREADDVGYIMIIGVDKGSDGKQKVTYQIAVPRWTKADTSNASGMGGGQGSSGEPWVISTIWTPGPAETRMLLNSTMSRYPLVSHINAYIFSEEVAREGLGSRISYLVRSREFRETMFLLIVRGSVEEYIKNNKPALETYVYKFYESTFLSADESGYYMRVHFHDFYTRLKNHGGSAYAAYTGLNPYTGSDKPAGAKTPEQTGPPYLPGGIPRTATSKAGEFLGLALFRGDKMVGVLNSDETRAVAILQGKLSSGFIGLADPLQPEKETVNLKFRPESQIHADLNRGVPVFHVKVLIEGEILGATSGIPYEAPEYRNKLEDQLAKLFTEQIRNMIRHTQELGTDPVGFGLYLRPKFRDTGEMAKADLNSLYQKADVQVQVTARINTGLQWRTVPPKNQ